MGKTSLFFLILFHPTLGLSNAPPSTLCDYALLVLNSPNHEAQLLNLASLIPRTESGRSEQLPTSFRRAIDRLGPEAALGLAQAAQRLSLGLAPSSGHEISLHALEQYFPWLTRQSHTLSPQVLGGFQRTAFQEEMQSLSMSIARYLGESVPPSRRRALALQLLRSIRDYPPSWWEQTHLDRLVDLVIGFRANDITRALQSQSPEEIRQRYSGEETWFRYGNQNLLTPYFEFQLVLDRLNPQRGQRLVDLGSGFGRQGIYMGLLYPEVQFDGYEIVPQRVREGRRISEELGFGNVHFYEQNMAGPNWRPRPADFYYAFNPVSGPTFDRILRVIRDEADRHNRSFTIVVSGPAQYNKFTDPASGFEEIKQDARFVGDDFARYFRYTPRRDPRALISNEERPNATLPASRTWPGSTNPIFAEEVPTFPYARALGDRDYDGLAALLTQAPSLFSHMTVAALTVWNPSEHYQVSRLENALLISREAGGRQIFFEPIGVTTAAKAKIIEAILTARPNARFEYVSEATRELLIQRPELQVAHNRDQSDYVYLSDRLAALAPSSNTNVPRENLVRREDQTREQFRDFKDQVNQAHKFFRNHPDAQYVEFVQGSLLHRQVLEFLDRWESNNGARVGEEGRREIAASRALLNNLNRFNLVGRAITFNGQVVAYTLGQLMSNDTFVVYSERGERMDGVNAFLAGRLAQELRNNGVKYINRQDDSGDPGLRRRKQAFDPLRFNNTFVIGRRSS